MWNKTKKIKLTVAYYQDYKLYELDWNEFLLEYEDQFNSSLIGLNYERFFPEIGDNILRLKIRIQIYFLKFSKNFDNKISNLTLKYPKNLERLTVADIVLSVLKQQFVERKNIILKLTT
ncbi:hypothetical protein [Chishuiella sp.]|uniref:hypothetical protein n=1 Tax=Chishuiella sp. TaxID=1969467 RepID=UPI0028A9A95C|nr:hypothetical protein [Chishuiella sp.]